MTIYEAIVTYYYKTDTMFHQTSLGFYKELDDAEKLLEWFVPPEGMRLLKKEVRRIQVK